LEQAIISFQFSFITWSFCLKQPEAWRAWHTKCILAWVVTSESSVIHVWQFACIDSREDASSTQNALRRCFFHLATNWVVTTLARVAGISGTNNGLGADAQFDFPTSVKVDAEPIYM
jgi:hypothetical protein